MKILVAGGAGYIGTHTCVALSEAGHDLVVVDSLVNGRSEAIRNVQRISGREIAFIEADVRDTRALDQVFTQYEIEAVINFAGYKSVSESVARPLEYYDNNINSMISLIRCMLLHDVRTLVFSSTAAVYGKAAEPPFSEDSVAVPINAYGRTKLHVEEMLRDLGAADSSWKIAILRYFNPVGAHPSGLIGELPRGNPDNLMPYIAGVAAGELEKLRIFGGDYDTADGTAIRDYIHVMDLARGHAMALDKLQQMRQGGIVTLNLGTGRGYSVLEMLKAFETVCGRTLPREVVGRRVGDVACSFADPGLARTEIGWQAELGIDDMCRDAWNWKQLCGASVSD